MRKKLKFIYYLISGIYCYNAYGLSTGIGGDMGEVVGFTCRDGQVCCSYNDKGGCMRCAASYDSCPSCACPTECPSTEWSTADLTTAGKRCVKVSTLTPAVCACEYRCETGYYVDGTECKACPGLISISTSGFSTVFLGRTESPYNSGDITSCFIPALQSISDKTGKYSFTYDCYYKEDTITPIE